MAAETDRIHLRIDEIFVKLAKMETSTATMAATCAICKPIVVGNGKDGVTEQFGEVGSRLNALEQMSGLRSKGFWLAVGALCSVCVAVTGAAFAAGIHYLAE